MATPKDDSSSRSCEFFKVYISQHSSEQLELPPAVATQLGGKIPRNCTIEDPTGKLWQVEVEEAKEGHFIVANGWQDFASHHSLLDGDFLIFEYDGNSRFFVRIYGRNGLRKRKAPDADKCSAQAKKGQQEGGGEAEAAMQSSSVLTRPRPPGLRPDKGYKMRNLGMLIKTTKKTDGNSAGTPSKPSSNPRSKPTRTESKPSVKIQEKCSSPSVILYDPPNGPHFATYVTRSTRYRLHVPKRELEKHKIELDENLILRNDEGKIWKVEVRRCKDDRCLITTGWTDFKQANKLEIGDLCVFEFVLFKDNVSSLLLVHIYRRDSRNKKPGSSKRQEAPEVRPNIVILE